MVGVWAKLGFFFFFFLFSNLNGSKSILRWVVALWVEILTYKLFANQILEVY